MLCKGLIRAVIPESYCNRSSKFNIDRIAQVSTPPDSMSAVCSGSVCCAIIFNDLHSRFLHSKAKVEVEVEVEVERDAFSKEVIIDFHSLLL
jgi:hypothetical protein